MIVLGTSFQDIYCQSRLLKIDKKLSLLPKPMYYSLNFRWLRYAISMFEYDIKPQAKLQGYTPFWEQDYYFVGDGTEKEFSISYQEAPNSLRVGDNLRGKTIYFNTALSPSVWGVVCDSGRIHINNDTSIFSLRVDDLGWYDWEDMLIQRFCWENNWLVKSYTFPNDKDYIITYIGDMDDIGAEIFYQPMYSNIISYEPYFPISYISTRSNESNSTYVEDSDYAMVFNKEYITYTLINAPSNLTDIWISQYVEGAFAYDLTEREITILAEAMVIPFVEQYKNNATLDKALIYGGSMRSHSPANLLDKHIASAEDQRNYVQSLISEYTYKTEYYTQDNFKPLGTFWARRNGR